MALAYCHENWKEEMIIRKTRSNKNVEFAVRLVLEELVQLEDTNPVETGLKRLQTMEQERIKQTGQNITE
jgi:hypothetical protein